MYSRPTEAQKLSLFVTNHSLSDKEKVQRSYDRARAIIRAYGLTRRDVEDLSPTYWGIQTDPILPLDSAAATLVGLHLNVVAGAIAMHVHGRPDLSSFLDNLLHFKIFGMFCVLEVDHAMGAMDPETTATALPGDQGFVLNTPHPGAAKFMYPTVPNGVPCTAVVLAKLIVDKKPFGTKPFLVPINDGYQMYPGIKARLLPRNVDDHMNYSITSFDHVRLPATSLLRTADAMPMPHGAQQADFLLSTWPVAVGYMSTAAMCIPCLARSAYSVAKYSQSQMAPEELTMSQDRLSLIDLSTQHTPILTALAQSFVLTSFLDLAAKQFSDRGADLRVRHGIASIFKIVAVQQTLSSLHDLSSSFVDVISGFSSDFSNARRIASSEGDVLGLSHQLALDILLGDYSLPESTHPGSPLRLHEQDLIKELRDLKSMSQHEGKTFDEAILPRCQTLIEAIGLRMSYDAALDAGLDVTITDLYLITGMERDLVWYIENLDFTQHIVLEKKRDCVSKALPKLDEWLESTGVTVRDDDSVGLVL